MTQAGEKPDADGPVGIGGWLVLPIIGLIVTLVRGVVHLASYRETMAGFDRLPDGLAAFFVFEFAGNVVVLAALPILLLVFVLQKSRRFPFWFIMWAGGGLAFIIVDLIIAQVFFARYFTATGTPILNEDSIRELFRSIITAGIWIPYMRASRRVANTFVN